MLFFHSTQPWDGCKMPSFSLLSQMSSGFIKKAKWIVAVLICVSDWTFSGKALASMKEVGERERGKEEPCLTKQIG